MLLYVTEEWHSSGVIASAAKMSAYSSRTPWTVDLRRTRNVKARWWRRGEWRGCSDWRNEADGTLWEFPLMLGVGRFGTYREKGTVMTADVRIYTPCSKISESPWTHRSKIVIIPFFVKLQQIGQRFVVNERVFCFPPHLNTVLTLICKIVNKIIQSLNFTDTQKDDNLYSLN